MDAGIIGGIVTAVCGGIAAVIGALALFKRATVPHNAAVSALRSLWDWVEFEKYDDKVPVRIKRSVMKILEYEETAEKNDDNDIASI